MRRPVAIICTVAAAASAAFTALGDHEIRVMASSSEKTEQESNLCNSENHRGLKCKMVKRHDPHARELALGLRPSRLGSGTTAFNRIFSGHVIGVAPYHPWFQSMGAQQQENNKDALVEVRSPK